MPDEDTVRESAQSLIYSGEVHAGANKSLGTLKSNEGHPVR